MLIFLARTDNRQGFKPVWLGTALAVLASLIIGAIIYFSADELSGRAEQVFEGIAMFIATGVLTWMIFWMRKQAVDIKVHLQVQIQSVLTSGSSFGLLLLVFIAVVREGIEAVLFSLPLHGSRSTSSVYRGWLAGTSHRHRYRLQHL